MRLSKLFAKLQYSEDEKKKVFLSFIKDSFIQKFEIFMETFFVHFSLKNKSSQSRMNVSLNFSSHVNLHFNS